MKTQMLAGLVVLLLFFPVQMKAAEGPVEKLAAKNIDRVEKGCQTELETYCTTVTPGEGRGLACIYAHNDKLSRQCEDAFYSSAQEFENAAKNLDAFVGACKADIEKLCSTVAIGGGRILECLEKNKKQVSSDCNEVRSKAKGDLGQKKDIDYQYHTANIQ